MPLLTEWQVSFLVTPESIRLIPPPKRYAPSACARQGGGIDSFGVWRLAFCLQPSQCFTITCRTTV
jgi:hypothetical protein